MPAHNREIHDYIAQDSPSGAAKVVSGIYESVQLLKSFPELGHKYRQGDVHKKLCEVARPLSNDLKGGYHINCPFRICRLGAGSCGNTRAELAPTRYRDGP